MPQPRFDRTPGKPGNRTQRYRWLTSPSHQLTWWLGQAFPNAVPLLYVTGFPKSGTTWLANMIADYFDLPLPLMSVFPVGCPSVVRGHLKVHRQDALGCYAMRDGRDAMVSLYFHLTRSIPEGDRPRMTRKQRRMFPRLQNKNNVRENLPLFFEQHFKRPLRSASRMHWGHHVDWYLDGPTPELTLVRYENLLQDSATVLESLVSKLTDDPLDRDQLAATIRKYSFQNQAGRAHGDENRESYFRKGESGDWKNYFSREAAEVFHEHCGAALIRAGYETDDSWVRNLGFQCETKQANISSDPVTN